LLDDGVSVPFAVTFAFAESYHALIRLGVLYVIAIAVGAERFL
jgi:hypothetical protein